MTLMYHGKWVRATTDQEEVKLPAYCDALFLQIVESFAKGYVEQEEGSLSRRLFEIEQGPLFRAAIAQDNRIQPYFGRIRGGGAESHMRRWGGSRRNYLDTFVASPS